MLVEINHLLCYEYAIPIRLSEQTIRLKPSIEVASYSLEIDPDIPVAWRNGGRGMMAAVTSPAFSIAKLQIRSKFAATVGSAPLKNAGPRLMDACRAVHDNVRYADRQDGGVQDPAETLCLGTGTCRDIAWLLMDVLRRTGYEARFVSGYYVHLGEVVSADLHAWVEVNEYGWIGIDPTFGVPVTGCHIPVASARHYRGAVPVSGKVEPETEVQFSWEIGCRLVRG